MSCFYPPDIHAQGFYNQSPLFLVKLGKFAKKECTLRQGTHTELKYKFLKMYFNCYEKHSCLSKTNNLYIHKIEVFASFLCL